MKKKVAFICVHNSCRSQMAEAIGNHLYGDYLECYSAGTELKDQINQDAVRIVKELYGIDMNAKGHHSKLIDEIPDPDIAISMGCDVGCPFIGRPFDDDWGLMDPTGKSDKDFIEVTYFCLCIGIRTVFFFQHFEITACCSKGKIRFGNALLV